MNRTQVTTRVISNTITVLIILMLVISKPASAVIVNLDMNNINGKDIGETGFFYFNVTIGGNERIPIANFSVEGLPHINGSLDGILNFNLDDIGTVVGNNITRGNYVIKLTDIYGWIHGSDNLFGYQYNEDTPPYLGYGNRYFFTGYGYGYDYDNGYDYDYDDYDYGYGYGYGYDYDDYEYGYGYGYGYGYDYGYGYGYGINPESYTKISFKIIVDTTGATAGSYEITGKVNTNDPDKPFFSTSTTSFTLNKPVNDTIAPIITNIDNSIPTYESVSITWNTNEDSYSKVKYGTASNIYSQEEFNTILTTSHSITLTGLKAETTYYFVVNSTDRSGNSNQSSEYNFTTSSYTTPITPAIISYAPLSSVNDTEDGIRTFNITTDQTVDVDWLINGIQQQTNLSVTSASYSNTSPVYGIWNVSAIVRNMNGADMQTWIWNMTGITISLKFNPDWNFISIPIIPDNPSVDSVFSDVDMFSNDVYEYEPKKGYYGITEVKPKVGYWVYSRTSCEISITGKPTSNNTINLKSGWNNIGLPVNPINSSVYSVFADVNMFNRDVYRFSDHKHESVTEVEPKVGYRVYSLEPQIVTVNGTAVTS